MINYVAVTDPEEGKKIEQEMYKYMPTFIMSEGSVRRVLAQKDGKVYYKAYNSEEV